jgi:hypothetical protein
LPVEQLRPVGVVMTVVDGEVVYEAGSYVLMSVRPA